MRHPAALRRKYLEIKAVGFDETVRKVEVTIRFTVTLSTTG